MEAASTLKALKMAVKSRAYQHLPLIHHSDRGLQYCSKLYTDYLVENKITISMTETGSPYDNAVAERVNGILKDEFGLSGQLDNHEEALLQVKESIYAYNFLRPHLSCYMLTPDQMHQQETIKIKTYLTTLYHHKIVNLFQDVTILSMDCHTGSTGSSRKTTGRPYSVACYYAFKP